MDDKKEIKPYKSSEHTQKAIIDAAGKLAGQNGFHNISTRAIADLAGENLGSIHYHFGGKTPLFMAVIDEAIADCLAFTAEDAIKPFQDELDTPTGQAKAIRALINRHISKLFDPDKPTWHTKVIYQLLQNKSELQDYLKEKLIDKDSTTQNNLIKRIMPEVSDLNIHMYSIVMTCPAFFHSTNMEFILTILGEKKFSKGYLAHLEDILVIQTLLLFNLPIDKKIDLNIDLGK